MNYYTQFLEDVVSSTAAPTNPVKDQLWWKLPENVIYIWSGTAWVVNRGTPVDDPTKAPLASPHFTGVPTAPTASLGNSTTQLATTAFVQTALDNDTVDWAQIVNEPVTFPPTLPIAQSGISNLVSDLALKAPKDSPVFTGNPQAPTPIPGDNDLSIATTAFVKTATDGLLLGGTVNQYLRGDKTWQDLNKTAVGLGNVDNTSDANKPVSTAQANADALRVLKSGDTMSGQLTISPVAQAAVISLLGQNTQNAGIVLSINNSTSSIFVESRNGNSTRWQMFLGDSTLESGVAGESGGTNFALRRFRNDGVFLGDAITIQRSSGVVSFPAGATTITRPSGDSTTSIATTAFVTSATSDKEPPIAPGSSYQYWRGDKTWQLLDKSTVGLSNVDNTSDLNKPISAATQVILDLKATINNPVFTGKVTLPTGSTISASGRVPHGTAPTTPINGDFWSTSTGFYGQVNGVTVGPWGPGIQGIPGIQGPKGDKGDPGGPGSQVMYIGDGPPLDPIIGQTWFESDTGNSFIYYNDGTSTQWVPTHVGTLPESEGGGGTGEGTVILNGVGVPSSAIGSTGDYYVDTVGQDMYGPKSGSTWPLAVPGESGGGAGGPVAWVDITGKPATFPPTLPIAQSGITNLVSDLAGKALAVHTHTQADITGLVTALAGKEPSLPSGGTTNNYLRGDKTWAEIDTGGLSFSYEYTFDVGTAEPVSSANVKFNHATAASVTKIWVHDLSAIGKDNANIFTLFTAGDRLYFQDKDDSTKWQSFNLTGPSVDKGTYTEFPVTFRNGGLALPAQRIVFIVEGGTSTGFTQSTADGLYVNVTGDIMSGSLKLPAGAVALPSLAVGETNSGLYSNGLSGTGYVLGVSVNGVLKMRFADSANISDQQFRIYGGTAAIPGFSFSAETNSGWYWAATGNIRMVMGGTTIAQYETTGLKTTYSGPVITSAASATRAGLNVPHGTAPTTPANGDLWSTTAGFYGQVNGTTVGPFSTGGGGSSTAWADITGKPSTFPPTLPIPSTADVTGLNTALSGKASTTHTHAQADVTNLVTDLAGKASTVHVHAQSDITNLITDLALKAPLASPGFTGNPTAPTPLAGDNDTSIATTAFVSAAIALAGVGGGSMAWADITGKPSTFPPTVPIAQADITNLTTDLAGKAASVHTHAQADITNLTTDLTGRVLKAGDTMTGPLKLPTGVANNTSLNFGTVGTGFYGDATNIRLAISNTSTLHLTAFFLTSSVPILLPNTAPLSDTYAASKKYVDDGLVLKAPLASPAFTGTPTAPTPTVGDNDTSIATTAFVTAAVAAGGGGGGISEAPNDGGYYARRNLAWATLPGGSFTGGTLTSKLTTAPATAGYAGLNIPNSTADPTSPLDGDVWLDDGYFAFRQDGQTVYLLADDSPFLTSYWTFAGSVSIHGAWFQPSNADQPALNIEVGVAPTSPWAGDIWTTNNGAFVYISGVTERMSYTGGKIHSGTTAPSSPAVGDIWIDIS